MFLLVCTSHIVNPRSIFPFEYTSHTVTPRKTFPFAGTSHTIFPIKSFVIALPFNKILTILSFALLNASHMVRRRNCVAKAVHHTQFFVVNVCARWPNSFQEDVVCDCSLIQHVLFLETVCVA